MNCFNFSSAMRILADNRNKAKCSTELKLLTALLRDYIRETDYHIEQAAVSLWMNDERTLPQKIIRHYEEYRNQRLLCETVEEEILDLLTDPMKVALALKEALKNAENISDSEKEDLIEDTVFETDTEGLYADYYHYNPYVSTKTYYKYANASTPYPHFLEQHYSGPSGYRRNLSDMMGIVDACPSITLLRQTQSELHQWVSAYLTAEEADAVNCNYVAQDANRREIAIYLADVVHYALCRKNVGNRPTDVGVSL